ncbi:MAG: hypothetical protein IT378_02790 [Sandaracinaceae bacterium]|nr:hypothetical protein [Sandaracinaceae bacterium]
MSPLRAVLVVALTSCSGTAAPDAGPDASLPPADASLDGGPDAATDPTRIIVRFDPAATDFYRLPWPSDARLTADGTPDMTGFPARRGQMDETLDEIERAVHGFATMPVAYFALTAPVTEASLPQGLAALEATSAIQMIDLSEQGCGGRLPLEVAFAAEGDNLREENLLQVANAIGTVLRPGRPYGVVILRSFGAPEGRSTPRPAAFDAALADTTSADPLAVSLAPLRRCLPSTDLSLDDVAVATVFTPQDPVSEMRALARFAADTTAVSPRPVTGWRVADGWSRRRLALTTYTGVVQMPIFQEGVSPYDDGGGLVFDAGGQPVIQRWEEVEIAVAMRELAAPPPGPRPVLVFMDGTGWDKWTHLPDNWIVEALDAGYVVMSFMPQFHGGRAGFAGNTELSSFNLLSPPAGRSNFRQQAAETIHFARIIREQIATMPGVPPLDTDNLVYGGQSQGALCGAIVAGVDDTYRGFVLNGLSSYLTLTVLFREDILDFEQVVSTLYGFRGTLDRFHPLLQILQMGADVVDPHNYGPSWRAAGNSVFVSNGYEDTTTTPRGIEHLTMCADMPPIAPPGWDIDPVGVWDGMPVALPVEGNTLSAAGDPLTIATFLDFTRGHGTIYGNRFVRELAATFWETARAGVPRLSSRAEHQCGDGTDEDLDGLADCDDPDCAARAPCVEGACDNMIDEDMNGQTDCDDPVCATASACRERACGDSMDNDGDGATDCADTDCAARAPCAEERCADGRDDDGDSNIDCADSQCAGRDECRERFCSDGTDNDRDGAIDCEDSECLRSAACPEASCTDGTDEDMNGLIDCGDPGCAPAMACERMHESACGNGADDDGDGASDCADADCALDAACPSTTCAHGDLGTQTGLALWRGSIAGRTNDYPVGDCVGLGAGGDAPDLAFTWTAPAAGDYRVSTMGSAIDTVLSVLGPDCDPVGELACNDDQSPLSTSSVTVTLADGESIVIVIGAYDADLATGEVVLHIVPES